MQFSYALAFPCLFSFFKNSWKFYRKSRAASGSSYYRTGEEAVSDHRLGEGESCRLLCCEFEVTSPSDSARPRQQTVHTSVGWLWVTGDSRRFYQSCSPSPEPTRTHFHTLFQAHCLLPCIDFAAAVRFLLSLSYRGMHVCGALIQSAGISVTVLSTGMGIKKTLSICSAVGE